MEGIQHAEGYQCTCTTSVEVSVPCAGRSLEGTPGGVPGSCQKYLLPHQTTNAKNTQVNCSGTEGVKVPLMATVSRLICSNLQDLRAFYVASKIGSINPTKDNDDVDDKCKAESEGACNHYK